jgi:hypothetical protein
MAADGGGGPGRTFFFEASSEALLGSEGTVPAVPLSDMIPIARSC